MADESGNVTSSPHRDGEVDSEDGRDDGSIHIDDLEKQTDMVQDEDSSSGRWFD